MGSLLDVGKLAVALSRAGQELHLVNGFPRPPTISAEWRHLMNELPRAEPWPHVEYFVEIRTPSRCLHDPDTMPYTDPWRQWLSFKARCHEKTWCLTQELWQGSGLTDTGLQAYSDMIANVTKEDDKLVAVAEFFSNEARWTDMLAQRTADGQSRNLAKHKLQT